MDDELMAAIDAGDEPAARARAQQIGVEDAVGFSVYCTAKRGVALWVRRNATTKAWAAQGITLNPVAPGMIHTPLVKAFDTLLKMPLNGWAVPEEVAELMAFLNSPGNKHITGQCVFIDGGTDVIMRGDSTW